MSEQIIERLRKLATVELIRHEEYDSYQGHFEFEEDIRWIEEQLERGNEWAWCCVEVKASFAGREASDFLGGCSYHSEKDFKQPGGYYDDMVNEALAQLAADLVDDYRELAEIFKEGE